MNDAVNLAHTALLDALDALSEHIDALVVVGARAVYLHTGAAKVALAEHTTDGDLAIDPDLLGPAPHVERRWLRRASSATREATQSAPGSPRLACRST